MTSVPFYVLVAVILVAVVACVFVWIFRYKKGQEDRQIYAEGKIGGAEEKAEKIVNDAIKAAEQKRKEVLLEAKDEIFRLKADGEKELKDRRNEITRQERRLNQKEENLDKKTDAMEKREADQKQKELLIEAKLAEVEQVKERELQKLETISGLSQDAAKALILEKLDRQLTHEKAVKISAYEAQLKEDSDEMARDIITQAIARCARDHSAEAVVSTVSLPNDEMKGRIIAVKAEISVPLKPPPALTLLLTTHRRQSQFPALTQSAVKLQDRPWKNLFPMAVFTHGELKKPLKKPAERWNLPSRKRAKGRLWTPAYTVCTLSLSSL